MLRYTVRLELAKALKNKSFYASLFIGCSIAFLAFLYDMGIHKAHLSLMQSEAVNPMYASSSLFNLWIGGEPFSLGSTIYFFVFPLLAAIPYGWSYCEEKNGGYIRLMIARCGRRNYFLSKYIAVFLSGALAMVIPLIFSFLISALYFPAVLPSPIYCTTNGIFYDSLMSTVYYTVPLLYVFIYLCVDFIFGGLIACVSYVCSCFVKYSVVAVILPLFLLLAFHYIRQFVYVSPAIRYKEISPLYFLRPVQVTYSASWTVILIEAIALFLATVFLTLLWERRHEVY